MSQLELNIPITFEAAAALTINDGIEQKVQNINGEVSRIEQKADNITIGVQNAGINIDAHTITLNAETTQIKNGNTTTAMFTSDGKISANLIDANSIVSDRFETTGNGQYSGNLQKAHIVIEDGLFKVFGNAGVANIVIGYDSDSGQAILKYYNNSNEMLYDLGPDGINKIQNYNESVTQYTEYPFYRYYNGWINDYTASSHDYDQFNQACEGTYGTYIDGTLTSFFSKMYNNSSFMSNAYYYLYTAGYHTATGIDKGCWATTQLASNANGKYFRENPTSGSNRDQSWYENNLLDALFIVKNGNIPRTEVIRTTTSLTEGVDYEVQGEDGNGYYNIEFIRGEAEGLNCTGEYSDWAFDNINKATYDMGDYRFVDPIIAIQLKCYEDGEPVTAIGTTDYTPWIYISSSNLAVFNN